MTPPKTRRRYLLPVILILVLLSAAIGAPALFNWQREGEHRAVSFANLRRLSAGALLYAQDWDSRLMPVIASREDGGRQTWPEILSAYVPEKETFNSPANSILPESPGPIHPRYGVKVQTSYALNRRFQDTFAPGPFPLDNLELHGQTALFVEAGPLSQSEKSIRPSRQKPGMALLEYGDTLDRVNGLCPYPSAHDGKMVIAAVDGHAVMVPVEHYHPDDGPHDPLYGRLGGEIYNWNGGHPNGATDRPVHE